MTDEGDLMLTGIKQVTKPNFNFYPSAQVWLLHLSTDNQPTSASGNDYWLWALLALVGIALIFIGITLWKRRSSTFEPQSEPQPVIDDELMQRIVQLMEQEKPYLSSELKVSDLADRLGVNSRTLSDCIRNSTGSTFANFINAYRIDYAKALMRQQPDMKISEVFLSSGFANETTFYRIFKAVTGMTPNEWKAKID